MSLRSASSEEARPISSHAATEAVGSSEEDAAATSTAKSEVVRVASEPALDSAGSDESTADATFAAAELAAGG